MKDINNRKGFVLLLVVALIPLVGMVSLVLIANSKHLFTQSRRLAIKTHAQQACESGIEWIKSREDSTSFILNQSVVLELDHQDKIITCTIEKISQVDGQSLFNITGYAKDKRFSYKYQSHFRLQH